MDDKKVKYVVNIQLVGVVEGTVTVGEDGIPKDIIMQMAGAPMVNVVHAHLHEPQLGEEVITAMRATASYRVAAVATEALERKIPGGTPEISATPATLKPTLN
jgi:hypothetical protein